MLYDPYDHSVQDNPFPIYEVMRNEYPCYRDPEGRFFAISRDSDVREALRDHATFSNAGGIILGGNVDDAPPTMVTSDPPEHTRLRSLVSRAFTPRRVAALEDRLRDSVVEFIGDFAGESRVDLVPAFADVVPVRAISDIVGVPAEEREQFRAWADDMLGKPGTQEAVDALMACYSYFGEALEERRADPRDDMLTAMVEAEIDGETLATEEQIGMILLLFFAGIETTVFHMSNIAYYLGTLPDLQQQLRDDPALIPDAMEEILRFDAPVQGDIRTLRRDVELHGETMGEGDVVLVLLGSANRDPEAVPDPEEFDITRSPNPHLTFAAGPHFCLGAPLVRLEHRVAVEELLARVPPFTVDPRSARRRHMHGPVMRGFESVPVEFS